MFCHICGKQVEEDSKICIHCGTVLLTDDDDQYGIPVTMNPSAETEPVSVELPDFAPMKYVAPGTAPASKPAPKAEPVKPAATPAPVQKAQAAPKPQPVSAPAPVQKAQAAPKPQPVSAPAPVQKLQPAPVPRPQTAPAPVPAPKPQPASAPAQKPAAPKPAAPMSAMAQRQAAMKPGTVDLDATVQMDPPSPVKAEEAPAQNAQANRPMSSPAQVRAATARQSAPVKRPASTPRAVPSGAYVPKDQVRTASQLNYPSYSGYSGSDYSGSWSTPGRIPAIIGAILMAISMFLPYISYDRGRSTESYSWYKVFDAAEKPDIIILLFASAIALLMAVIDIKGTKIAYFCYSVYVGIFCVNKMRTTSDAMEYLGYWGDFERGIGYYAMIISAIVVVIAGIVLLVNLNYGENDTSYYHSPNSAYLNQDLYKPNDFARTPSSSEWRCNCGRINPNFTGTCACGLRKSQVAPMEAAPVSETNRAKQQAAKEYEKISLLKEYKELLDSGIITKEEFNEKKKNLLG